METKIMQQTEKKIATSLEKGVKAGREIALAVNNLFEKWEENDEYNLPAEWLADKFEFSKQYIYKMQQVAERFLNNVTFDGLSITVLAEALPLSDQDAEDYFISCAENGEKVTAKKVREYVKSLKCLESLESEDDNEAEKEEIKTKREVVETTGIDYDPQVVAEKIINIIETVGTECFERALELVKKRI